MGKTLSIGFPMDETLAAAPSTHVIALKRYRSARGRRDLRTESLVTSDESEDSDVGRNDSCDSGSDAGSDAGSMVAQSSSAVQAVKPVLPAPPPGMDPLLFISSSKVLSFMAASCEDLTMNVCPEPWSASSSPSSCSGHAAQDSGDVRPRP